MSKTKLTDNQIKELQDNCKAYKEEVNSYKQLLQELEQTSQITSFNWQLINNKEQDTMILRSTAIVDQLRQQSMAMFHLGKVDVENNLISWTRMKEEDVSPKEKSESRIARI